MQFNETGTPRWADAWGSSGVIDIKWFSQGYYDALPSLRTEPRIENLALSSAELHRNYSCASDSVKCLSRGHNSDMHQTSNLKITIRSSKA